MSDDLSVPDAMEAAIRNFDSAHADLDTYEINQRLRDSVPEAQALTEAERRGAYAETLPFGLMPTRVDASPWGIYFGPMGSAELNDGTQVYFPDIAHADARSVAHWMHRARTVLHPILKARYADVAWEIAPVVTGGRRDADMARIAIDAYLATPTLSPPPSLFARIKSATRALALAIVIKDQERIEKARLALMTLHREAVAARSQWWNTFDELIDNKRAGATDAEREELIVGLEGLLADFADAGDPSKFNPHHAESAAKRLVRFYRRSGRKDDVRRLHTLVGRVFEHFAELANPMLAATVLQTAVNAYHDAGLPDEAARARILMEGKIGAAVDDMDCIETEIEIQREDMDKFLASVIFDDLGRTFINIAAKFLCSRANLERLIHDIAKEAPIQAIVPQTQMAADHVAAKIGSVTEDLNGRVVGQAVQSLALDAVWLDFTLAAALDRHAVTPHHIVAWANRLALFDDVSFLLEGVTAWHEHDFTKAVHVLVPQIEAGLRSIVGKLGKPVTKAHGTLQGIGVSINMGDILNNREIVEALGPDIVLHFLALYADPRGRNLRNKFAHGLMTRDAVSRDVVNCLIHSLLVFGIWDKLAERRRPDAASAS